MGLNFAKLNYRYIVHTQITKWIYINWSIDNMYICTVLHDRSNWLYGFFMVFNYFSFVKLPPHVPGSLFVTNKMGFQS